MKTINNQLSQIKPLLFKLLCYNNDMVKTRFWNINNTPRTLIQFILMEIKHAIYFS